MSKRLSTHNNLSNFTEFLKVVLVIHALSEGVSKRPIIDVSLDLDQLPVLQGSFASVCDRLFLCFL